VSRNWAEITSEDYVFDRLPREVECIHKITKSDMIGFYRSLMDDTKNMRKLSTIVVGHEKGVTSAGDGESEIEEIDFDNQKHLQFLNLERPNTVLDLETIRTAMPVYPVTKTSLK
jgi:nardilysin